MLGAVIVSVVGTALVLLSRVWDERKNNTTVLHSRWPLPIRFLLLSDEVKAALIVLVVVRLGCAGVVAYMAVTWAGFSMFPWFLWDFLPAILVFTGARWPIWVTIVGNSLAVVAGLLALLEFGHLHGGEIYAYAAIPAAVELAAGLYSIVSIRQAQAASEVGS